MSPHSIAMARFYGLVFLFGGCVVAVHECWASPVPRAEALSVPASEVTTAELAARVEFLELRMESRDDAIEALLWLAEQDRKERCDAYR